MAGMHRFWSFYEDASCSGAPTGVFIQRRNECVSQVASSGANCVAQYDDSNALVGYVDESCHEGRAAGLDELYDGEPYMAYDYYYDTDCTDYENSASYRASGGCETLYDGYSPVRSATISISNGMLTWTRNMGSVGSALKCPGSTGPGYCEFDVSTADINANACKNAFSGIEGGFVFYNKAATSTTDTTSSDISDTNSSSTTRSTFGSSFGESESASASTSRSTSEVHQDSSSASSVSTSSSSGSGLPDTAVVGIAAGVAVVLVVITAVSCWLWKRNKRNSNDHPESMQHPFIARGSAFSGGPTDGSEPSTLGPGL